MKTKKIAAGFLILLFLGMFPFPFTKGPQLYIGGWLPVTLLYWWILMIVNLIFVLWVCREFVKNAEKEKKNDE